MINLHPENYSYTLLYSYTLILSHSYTLTLSHSHTYLQIVLLQFTNRMIRCPCSKSHIGKRRIHTG